MNTIDGSKVGSYIEPPYSPLVDAARNDKICAPGGSPFRIKSILMTSIEIVVKKLENRNSVYMFVSLDLCLLQFLSISQFASSKLFFIIA
jgi:hypothetical protein